MQQIFRNRGIAAETARVCLLLALAGCSRGAGTEVTVAAADEAATCVDGGSLSGQLVGALQGTVDWRSGELECEGMPRPDGAGARLRFSGPIGDPGSPLVIIVALPALERGEPASELAATVTIIDEQAGRFFSNTGDSGCWGDVQRQRSLAGNRFAVEGLVYCVAPLVEINGPASVSFTELRFVGQVDWSES